MTKKFHSMYAFLLFSVITSGSAIASECPFADTFDMISVKEHLSGPLSKKKKLAMIDESVGLIQEELKKKTVLDHPMTKIEAAACTDDLKKLKSKRAQLSQ